MNHHHHFLEWECSHGRFLHLVDCFLRVHCLVVLVTDWNYLHLGNYVGLRLLLGSWGYRRDYFLLAKALWPWQ